MKKELDDQKRIVLEMIGINILPKKTSDPEVNFKIKMFHKSNLVAVLNQKLQRLSVN